MTYGRFPYVVRVKSVRIDLLVRCLLAGSTRAFALHQVAGSLDGGVDCVVDDEDVVDAAGFGASDLGFGGVETFGDLLGAFAFAIAQADLERMMELTKGQPVRASR